MPYLIENYEHIVWDFNGTLLDDLTPGYEATNLLLARRALPMLPDAEAYRRVFDFPIRNCYIRLGFDFERESYEKVAAEWTAEYERLLDSPRLRPGAAELLRRIGEVGIPQSVISACEEGRLRRQIGLLGIAGYFRGIYGRNDIYADDKTGIARRFTQTQRPGRTLMIGDTDHDFACASAAGFDCVLLCGGFQEEERLRACGCPVVQGFEELAVADRRDRKETICHGI